VVLEEDGRSPAPCYIPRMPHPATQREIIAALESNAHSIVEFFTSVPDRLMLEGDPDHWGPAHHLIHLTQASTSVARALAAGALPLHPTARSRTYAEVRDAATSSLTATPKARLLEMGRIAVIAPGTGGADIVNGFVTASGNLRSAAAAWTEDDLDRHALAHSLMGELTVREMLLFFVLHERHHLKIVRATLEGE
jgi:DinB superfamily